MGQMTLVAVTHGLPIMIKFSCPGMADRAGYILMGRAAIRGWVDQWIAGGCPVGIVLAGGTMAMETESGYRFCSLRICGRCETMALQALFVFSRQLGQFGLQLMANAAFGLHRLAEVDLRFCFGIGGLIMRIVAADAVIDHFRVRYRFPAVASGIDVIHGVGMAFGALLRLKERFQCPGDFSGIRVELFFGDISMTVLAGYLAVNRDVKSFSIDQPGGFRICSAKDEETQQ
jgi:hypothetical protein